MQAIARALEHSVASGEVPYAVAMTASAAGITGCAAAGEAAPGRAAGPETMFRIFSMTKAIGSLAALILIDRGRLSLDTPVAEILPEWADLPVLEGWEGDRPRLRPQRARATIRHLATHTSGAEYPFWNADLRRYLRATGQPAMPDGRRAALRVPLCFDAGARWGYGPSTDWLGLVVETVSGQPIDAFCQDEIFAPLGMRDTVFDPAGRADRLGRVMARDAEGGFAPMAMAPPDAPEFYGMGHALYATAPDYLRFLRLVLGGGALEGRRLISAAAAQLLHRDQMRGLAFRRMVSVSPRSTADVDFGARRMTHSFAFLRAEQDWPGKRRAGALGWAGILNTHYWIDPAAGLAAVFMTQSLPFVEPGAARALDRFERAVYAAHATRPGGAA